jgi:hypothetical protein
VEEIAGYLGGRNAKPDPEPVPDDIAELAFRFWHGDLDLEKLVKAIGADEVEKALRKCQPTIQET